jgi:sugar (pentulose or hexulose) kinase
MTSDDGPLFIAIDVGTTGARASAVDLAGHLLQEARKPYETTAPKPGWAEQDPRDWRESSLDALAELVIAIGDRPVAAVGLTGQCPTIAPLDAEREPVGPGLLYRDNRAGEQATEMRRRFGEDRMHERTGHLAEAFHVGPKVLWMRERAPDVFAATDCFMQPRDVALHALTAVSATDETHANSTVFFDLVERCWATDLLEEFSLTQSLFPQVHPAWTIVGEIGGEMACRAKALRGCPVILGAADSQCAQYGSAVAGPGPISEMAGASSCLNALVEKPLRDTRVTHYSYLEPDWYSTELGVNTTGAALRWAVTQLGFEDFAALDAAAQRGRETIRAGRGADPRQLAPVFLPYLGDGERDDVALRAAFIGLSDRHTRDELAYAVLEGVAFAVADTLDILRQAGLPVEELRVAGGVTRVSALSAIKADVLGVPVRHLTQDSAPVGVALLAAAVVGFAAESAAALSANLATAQTFEPDAAARDAILTRYRWFLDVRGASAVRVTS